MGINELGDILKKLEPWIFRIHNPVDDCHGTGFFITEEFALTAFHNLYDSIVEDDTVKLSATFGGEPIDFVWELRSDEDRKWQKLYDVAVLRAVKPLPEAPKEKFLYLDAGCKGPNRDRKWTDRKLVALGIPNNSDQVAPIPGRTRIANALVAAPRIVGRETKGTIPAALYFSGDINDVNAAYGMSGSPVYDEELGGIIGVVVAVGAGFYATELVHVVQNWPTGREYLHNFSPKRNFVAEYAATATPRRAFGILAIIVAFALIFWFKSVARIELEVKFVNVGSARVETAPILWIRWLGLYWRNQINAKEGEKFQLLITSPTDGYLYVVDREVTRDGTQRMPYLVFPTLSTGVGRNRVKRGTVVSFPDVTDRSPTIWAKPSDPQDRDYAGEALTFLVYDSPLVPVDHLEARPIPLTPEQFPDDGDRLLFSSDEPAPKAARKVHVVVQRASQGRQPQVDRPH